MYFASFFLLNRRSFLAFPLDLAHADRELRRAQAEHGLPLHCGSVPPALRSCRSAARASCDPRVLAATILKELSVALSINERGVHTSEPTASMGS
jgi:hypothetical protein